MTAAIVFASATHARALPVDVRRDAVALGLAFVDLGETGVAIRAVDRRAVAATAAGAATLVEGLGAGALGDAAVVVRDAVVAADIVAAVVQGVLADGGARELGDGGDEADPLERQQRLVLAGVLEPLEGLGAVEPDGGRRRRSCSSKTSAGPAGSFRGRCRRSGDLGGWSQSAT